MILWFRMAVRKDGDRDDLRNVLLQWRRLDCDRIFCTAFLVLLDSTDAETIAGLQFERYGESFRVLPESHETRTALTAGLCAPGIQQFAGNVNFAIRVHPESVPVKIGARALLGT